MVAPQQAQGVAIKDNARYVTVLSSFDAVEFSGFTGAFPVRLVVFSWTQAWLLMVLSSIISRVAFFEIMKFAARLPSHLRRRLRCCYWCAVSTGVSSKVSPFPAFSEYISFRNIDINQGKYHILNNIYRSQRAAEKSWPVVPTAVLTIDFGFMGAHTVSVNQVKGEWRRRSKTFLNDIRYNEKVSRELTRRSVVYAGHNPIGVIIFLLNCSKRSSDGSGPVGGVHFAGWVFLWLFLNIPKKYIYNLFQATSDAQLPPVKTTTPMSTDSLKRSRFLEIG